MKLLYLIYIRLKKDFDFFDQCNEDGIYDYLNAKQFDKNKICMICRCT